MKLQAESNAKPIPTDGCSTEKQALSTAKPISTTFYRRVTMYSLLSCATITIISFVIVLSLNQTSNGKTTHNSGHSENDSKENTSTTAAITTTVANDMYHHMFTKADWKGEAATGFIKNLSHPTEYVIIFHTAGSFSDSEIMCTSIVQQIQTYHITQGHADIGYNFLIGGDGNTYVGRGWDYVNYHKDRSIAISFIGNFMFTELTPRMIFALEDLLKIGVKFNILSPNYKLVCHNQTIATLSPGKNVYKEMCKLPHFYDGRVTI